MQRQREKWGALSKVKKMPGCVCSSINHQACQRGWSQQWNTQETCLLLQSLESVWSLRGEDREAQTGGLLRALVSWPAQPCPGPSPARAPPTYVSAPSAECWVPWERLETTEDRDSRVRCWNLGNFRLLHFFTEWWNWLRPQIGRKGFSVETHQWDCSALTIL